MDASTIAMPVGMGNHQTKPLSWRAVLLLGAIVLCAVFGLSLLVQEMIFGDSRSAMVGSSDPGYRIQLLERAVSRYPENAGGWLQLGRAYDESGQYAQAASAYENYLAIDPRNPDIWTKLGVQYAQTDRPEKALEAFGRAISLNPKHEAAHLYKGGVLLNAFSDLRGAIRAWMQVLEANPDAQAPDGRPVEEWINYCQAASSTETTADEQKPE